MKLLYKQHILNEVNHITFYDGFFTEFWKTELINYAAALGFSNHDYYQSLQFVLGTDDGQYCGYLDTLEPKDNIHYYLYDYDAKEMYWFKCAGDAFYFASGGVEVLYRPQDGDAYSAAFEERRCKKIDNYLWLTETDFDYISVVDSTTFYHCNEYNKDFLSLEDAAEWLVSSGKASNKSNALKSLTKHLNGETKKCYSLTWKIQ